MFCRNPKKEATLENTSTPQTIIIAQIVKFQFNVDPPNYYTILQLAYKEYVRKLCMASLYMIFLKATPV